MTPVKKLLRILPPLVILGLFTAAANDCNGEVPYDPEYLVESSSASSIQPMAPIIPETDTIRLESPSFARTLPSSERIVFNHSTTAYKHGVLVILKNRPDVTLGRVSNLATDCVAGAASMAGQVFDGSLALGPDASDLYACTGDEKQPFSLTTKARTCPAAGPSCSSPFRTGVVYWWFVLGYDAQMKLTHSSPAFRFQLKD